MKPLRLGRFVNPTTLEILSKISLFLHAKSVFAEQDQHPIRAWLWGLPCDAFDWLIAPLDGGKWVQY